MGHTQSTCSRRAETFTARGSTPCISARGRVAQLSSRMAGAGKLLGSTASATCMMGNVWRKLRHDGTIAMMLIPLWESDTWWRLVVPDAAHFVKAVVV